MSRLATITDSLAELAELIEAASYALDQLDVLPDARRRLMRATETALPLVRWLLDAAEDDAEAALFEEMEHDDNDEGAEQ